MLKSTLSSIVTSWLVFGSITIAWSKGSWKLDIVEYMVGPIPSPRVPILDLQWGVVTIQRAKKGVKLQRKIVKMDKYLCFAI